MPFPAEFSIVKLLAALGLANASTGRLAPGVATVTAKTADYTVNPSADAPGTIFTNYGAAGAVNFTLPTPVAAQLGFTYEFIGVVDQNLTITAATADTLLVIGDAAADSIAASTSAQKIGAHFKAVVLQTGASTYQWQVSTLNNGVTGTVVTA